MNIKTIKKISLLVALLLITSMFFIGVPVEAELIEPISIVSNLYSEDLQSVLTNDYSLHTVNVVDCPENIDELEPSRTVLQIINNTYHKWNEYDLGINGEFCIVIEEPYHKALLESEANALLISSKSWTEQELQRSTTTEVLSPDDPRLNLPTIDKRIEVDTLESIYNLKNDSEEYIAEQKSLLINEYKKSVEQQGIDSINSPLSNEELESLLNDRKAITLLIDTTNKSSDEAKVDELEKKQSINEITEDITQSNYNETSYLLPQAEGSVSYWESETNYPESSADHVNSDYSGDPPYYLFGTITNTANDMDMYRFDVETSGIFDVFGIWVGDFAGYGWEEDLMIGLKNSSGEYIAVASLYGDGTSSEQQSMTVEVSQGTYYFIVMASLDYGDLYVGETYGLSVEFFSTESSIPDPTPITITDSYPVNTVGYVSMVFPNDGEYRATGFLVSPYTILTNGHVVFGSDDGGYATTLNFSPGQYQLVPGGDVVRPYGTKDAVSWETNILYENGEDFIDDYATAHFDIPFEGIDTFMPLVFNYVPEYVNVAGYPAMALGVSTYGMWHSYGEVIETTEPPELLCFLAYTYGGSSGGPVWDFNPETQVRRVVAINSFGASLNGIPLYNGGPKLTSDNQEIIEEWLQWAPPTEAGVSGYIQLEAKGVDNHDLVALQLTDGSNTYDDVTLNDGAFLFDNIENGEYTLTMEFNGYLSRQVSNIIVNDERVIIAEQISPIVIWAGDIDGLTGIDTGDLAYLISKLGLVDSDIGYDAIVDFDELTGIDTGDLALIIKNLGKTSNTYPTWVW